MKSSLIANEPNPYRRGAMLSVANDIEFKYRKDWNLAKVCWVVCGQFVWNIDKALNRSRVYNNNDESWAALEYVDDITLKSVEESAELYSVIDRALVDRVFKLKRIARRLAISQPN